jgi:hypothetical protein
VKKGRVFLYPKTGVLDYGLRIQGT